MKRKMKMRMFFIRDLYDEQITDFAFSVNLEEVLETAVNYSSRRDRVISVCFYLNDIEDVYCNVEGENIRMVYTSLNK
jgi:enamine deaminase RidA (YjgF/YER057c/UK114 family)